ncbi:hypothetical protein ACFPAF_04040 [Hymenobacter endophyticus]|uniref:Uncharacterized protein n=1 Tax=Hymenobacter endophyticus TaxID=3076335 RepID=A0ABU3TDX9_9BACT|nr:hypothetical protein [Hymenobacter endophyticus]MDU0369554.1 hypothetical protein [Hymenobacter endophyticus]
MLYNLTKSRAALQRLLAQEGKAYAPLVTELLPWVGSEQTPMAKELQEKLGLKPALFRWWLEACYADLIGLLATEPDVLQVQEVVHHLYLHGKRKTVEVQCRLPVTPRLYEQVELPLVGAQTGEYSYYVDGITHALEMDRLVIHISLQAGYYNAYVEHLRERAYFEGRITFKDLTELSRFELQEKLRELYARNK